MKTMLRTGAAVAAMFCSALAPAAEEGWTSDYEAAKKEAADSGKDLLVDFTGSDWCGWCIKLKDEVFKHDAFKTGVKDKFVLVEIDFPRDKSILSEETQKQNEELGKKYEIQGYPTILLTDAEGRPYAATGYQQGGPENYVKHLDELRGNKESRDKGLEAAAKLEGVEKAKALVAVLDSLGDLSEGVVTAFYGDVAETIKASDPEDVTGFTRKANSKKRLAEFEEEVGGLARRKDHEAAGKLVDAKLKEEGWEPEDAQKIAFTKVFVFAQQKKIDEALAALEETRKYAPESELAERLDDFKKQLEQIQAQEKATQGEEGEAEEGE